jgi:hypothetical protein
VVRIATAEPVMEKLSIESGIGEVALFFTSDRDIWLDY